MKPKKSMFIVMNDDFFELFNDLFGEEEHCSDPYCDYNLDVHIDTAIDNLIGRY